MRLGMAGTSRSPCRCQAPWESAAVGPPHGLVRLTLRLGVIRLGSLTRQRKRKNARGRKQRGTLLRVECVRMRGKLQTCVRGWWRRYGRTSHSSTRRQAQNDTAQHSAAQHNTKRHNTAQHNATQQSAAQHSITGVSVCAVCAIVCLGLGLRMFLSPRNAASVSEDGCDLEGGDSDPPLLCVRAPPSMVMHACVVCMRR